MVMRRGGDQTAWRGELYALAREFVAPSPRLTADVGCSHERSHRSQQGIGLPGITRPESRVHLGHHHEASAERVVLAIELGDKLDRVWRALEDANHGI